MNERNRTSEQNNDIYYIHLLRIIAVFCVIFIHTNDQGFMLFTLCTPGSIPFWVYMILAILAKSAVSLFFMISGAILLDKEESIKVVWKKRVLRFFILLFIISIFYCFEENYVNEMAYTFKSFLIKIYSSKLKYHLWYLYTYLAFLVFLPLLRSFVKGMRNKHFYYLIGICVSLKIVTFLEILLTHGEVSINHDFRLSWLFTNIFLLPIIGYFVHNKLDIEENVNNNISYILVLIVIISILCIMISTYFEGVCLGSFSEATSQGYLDELDFIIAGIIFAFWKKYGEKLKLSKQIKDVIRSVSNSTLGIYLIHPALRDTYLFERIYSIIHKLFITRIVTVFIYVIVVFGVSYLITFFLKKIPGIRKVI